MTREGIKKIIRCMLVGMALMKRAGCGWIGRGMRVWPLPGCAGPGSALCRGYVRENDMDQWRRSERDLVSYCQLRPCGGGRDFFLITDSDAEEKKMSGIPPPTLRSG